MAPNDDSSQFFLEALVFVGEHSPFTGLVSWELPRPSQTLLGPPSANAQLGPKDLEDVMFELGQLPQVMSLLSIRLQPFLTATTLFQQTCVLFRLQAQEEEPEPPLVQSFILFPFFTALRGSSASVIPASSQSWISGMVAPQSPPCALIPLQEALQ